MKELVIHIGYHKSGTTFLQKEVFNNERLGFAGLVGEDELAATHEFVNTEPVSFSPEKARLRFEPFIEAASSKQLVPVISDERLCSIPERGIYHLPYVMDCLKKTFGEFKVLVTIREQSSMAIALYRQAVRSGATFSLRHYLGTGKEPEGWTSLWQSSFFDYFRVYQYLLQAVGAKDKVLFLPFELMREDREQYFDKLFDFCGVRGGDVAKTRHNDGLPALSTELLRLSNRLVNHHRLSHRKTRSMRYQAATCHTLGKKLPKQWSKSIENQWAQIVSQRTGDIFKEGNRSLAAEIGIDLAKLGYKT